MYLYRTQHKILRQINKLIIYSNIPTENLWVSSAALAKRIKGLRKKEQRIAMALAALAAKGYTEYIGVAEDGSYKVKMTKKGLDALSLWEFRHLQDKVIGNIIRDGVTILVAIATIYSLIISATELRQTQEELKTIKEEIHKLRK